MSIRLDLGAWNGVFAVPNDIIDKYILIAGGPQLKVLLFILRHSGEALDETIISERLKMDISDVKDYINFWIETKILSNNSEVLTPAAIIDESTNSAIVEKENTVVEVNTKKERPISRHQKPSPEFVLKRISEDENIGYLMQDAEIILGRPISQSDASILLMLHDNDGLPIDVIMMLLQFCASENKGMKYVETVGIRWATAEIDTVEKAEQKIREITENKNAWKKVQTIFGLEHHSPTKSEKENAVKWINEWKFSNDMIRSAYEICIDSKGKYLPKYISKILETWHKMGYKTVEETKNFFNKNDNANNPSKKTDGIKGNPSYNIEEFDNYSIFD